jgi:hypothetical protein
LIFAAHFSALHFSAIVFGNLESQRQKNGSQKIENNLQRMTRRPNVKRVPIGFHIPVYPVHPCSSRPRIKLQFDCMAGGEGGR